MGLTLIATPIGNPQDLSIRGLETLKNAEVIILEERKEGTTLLRHHGITGKTYEELNEHSTPEDLKKLLEICKTQNVALITDCGTPGFCDPGADLVRLCRQNKVPIKTLPGPSSLMGLLSLSSQRIDQFVFRGFLAANTELREKDWKSVVNEKRAMVLMDTPYRLGKMVEELKTYLPSRKILITLDLTQEKEQILEGLPFEIAPQIKEKKAEFMILVYPS